MNDPPIANFAVPQVCVNDPFANFVDSSYGGGPMGLRYFWDFDTANAASTGDTSVLQNVPYKYAKAGIYNVLHATTDISSGCASSVTKQVTISGAAIVADFILQQSGVLCGNFPVNIQNKSRVDVGQITQVIVLWDAQANPSITDTFRNPLDGQLFGHVFPASNTSTTYQVKLTAYSGASCMSEKTISITIAATPKIVFSAVSPFCLQDSSRQLSASEVTGLPGNFTFTGKGVTASGRFNPSISGAGNHTVRYTYTFRKWLLRHCSSSNKRICKPSNYSAGESVCS